MKPLAIKLIEERIFDKLAEMLRDSMLLEMAIDRKKYEDKVDRETDQILINAILVRIASNTKRYPDLFNHWKGELRGHINNIRKLTIKNDSQEKRKKIINILWDEYDLNWRELAILIRVQDKLEDEGIDTDSKEVKDAIKWLISQIKLGRIQDLLVTEDNKEVQKYIDAI